MTTTSTIEPDSRSYVTVRLCVTLPDGEVLYDSVSAMIPSPLDTATTFAEKLKNVVYDADNTLSVHTHGAPGCYGHDTSQEYLALKLAEQWHRIWEPMSLQAAEDHARQEDTHD